MYLVIGLGNVGSKYTFTRHNAGFMIADSLAMKNSEAFIKPTTYMNLSGEALRAVIDYYKIPIENTLVVYDDLSLDLGKIRFRASGSDGGHNGIKSIIQHLGTNKFARLKIGIGPQPPIPSEAFVLQNFSNSELETLKTVINKSDEAIEYYFANGIQKTQNSYN